MAIDVYRGITGPTRDYNIYDGVSLEDLAWDGIACSNFSPAQYERTRWSGYETMEYDTDPAVPGLPVFLNEGEAVDWLRKRYRAPEDTPTGGLAVLGRLAIDEDLITNGTIKIYRNRRRGHELLSLAALQAHQEGAVPIVGEHFIADFPTVRRNWNKTAWDIREATTFYVPRAHKLNGEIDFSLAEPFIDLAELVDLRPYGPDIL